MPFTVVNVYFGPWRNHQQTADWVDNNNAFSFVNFLFFSVIGYCPGKHNEPTLCKKTSLI